jgi:F0F1-type ATP synthase assembly protein I
VLSQVPREKYLYNDSAREIELSKVNQSYSEYVSSIWNILQNHGVDTPEKLLKLKAECEAALKIREDRFTKINNKIVDMLIGVPLGALIASIIYANSNAAPIAIGVVILIGIIILGVVKLFKSIEYYSEGYFKDKYLLDAINELNYSEKIPERQICQSSLL